MHTTQSTAKTQRYNKYTSSYVYTTYTQHAIHKEQGHTSLLCFVHSLGLPLPLVAKQETADEEDDQEAEQDKG